MDKIKKEFEKFEQENNLWNLLILWYPAWEIVRFFVFQDILIQKWLVKQAIYPQKNFFYILKKSLKIIKNIFDLLFLYLFWRKKIDIFILWHPRRQKQKDWLYYDIYTDFIKEKLKGKNISYISFEETYFDFFDKISKTSKPLYRLDLVYFIYLLKLRFFNLSKTDFEKINKLEKDLNERFNVNIDLKTRIRKDILLFSLLVKFYDKLLEKLWVKKILEVVWFSIWAKALNYSSLKKWIQTYELQHWTILDNLACSLPEYFTWKTLPENLLTYWKFWNNVIVYPENQNIKVVGFPYLEKFLKNIKQEKNKNNILIISQWNISDELSHFTKKLALKYKYYNFFYKLHPWEFWNDKIIKENLIWLKNVKIIYDEYNIYELFGKTSFSIWVSSTSLYESFLFWNEIFLLPLNDWYKIFDYFLEKKYFNLIDLNKLELDFNKKNNKINYDYFLEKKSLNNILKLIKK